MQAGGLFSGQAEGEPRRLSSLTGPRSGRSMAGRRQDPEGRMAGNTPNLRGQELLAELSSRYVSIAELPWVRGGGAGIEQKVLFEDKERGMRTALIRWQPGAQLPLHEHRDFEQSYVLEGSLCDDEGECKA